MTEKEKILNELVTKLNEFSSELGDLENQFIVGYYRVKDDKLLGYHLSTSCQITDDILEAKRYHSDNAYEQLRIISDNLNYTLGCSEEEPGIMGLGNAIREAHFEGYHKGDIYLEAIYTDTEQNPKTYTYRINETD